MSKIFVLGIFVADISFTGSKIPFILVCGKKEVSENTVTMRKLGSEKQKVIKREDLIKYMLDLNKLPLN